MKKSSATATAQTSTSVTLSFQGSGLGNASKDALTISYAFTFSDAVAATRAIDCELVARYTHPQVIIGVLRLGTASAARTLTEGEETSRLCAE